MAENEHRTMAPGKPSEHPDVFYSLSGGVDCVAAYLTAKEAFKTYRSGGNFAKRPVALHLDTKTGTPLNSIYVEQLCDHYNEMLFSVSTYEDFGDIVEDNGAPGPGAHQDIRKQLKDRQASKVVTLSDDPIMVLGIAADESDRRGGFSKVREMDRHTEIYPVHRLSRKERVEIILSHEDCPINPLWAWPKVIRDCGCGCNGDPSEYDKTEELFPRFMQRLREWEEAIDHDGIKDTLGWGGLTAEEKSLKKNGHKQATLTTCDLDGGCRSRTLPNEVKAWRAAVLGVDRERCIEILYNGIEQPSVSEKVESFEELL